MKNIIVTIALMLAFSISANAQRKQTVQQKQILLTSHDKGINEATELTKYLGLNETQNTTIASILEQKHQTLEIKELSDERKRVLSEAVDAQIKASLNATQIEKFEKNTDLRARATH